MLQILTIHEAYPGHYVQLEYANRSPSLIRRVLGSGVFVEGWAVYTEQTLLDQGYGERDLALRLSQLGRMAHYRLRQSIQRELGDRFKLGRYHEAVLAHGSPPVKYLPELVRQSVK